MTFAELKAQLEQLTPEQLAAEVVWAGDERGGKVEKLWIAEEDWLDVDGYPEPRSVVVADLSPEDIDLADAHVIIPKGTPQLLVDGKW